MGEFDLYFAGVQSFDLGVQKFLYSQYNNRAMIDKLCASDINSSSKLFIDCGAWTAFTKGVTIDINEYISYINSIQNSSILVAALDVLPSGCIDAISAAEKSWDNFVYMREKICFPERLIPTFHQAEPIDMLKRMLTYQDDFGKLNYIAIGALANTRNPDARDKFFTECFNVISNYNKDIRVHAFGMTDLDLLERYPFYSADSTTWNMAAVMGEIITKWGRIVVSNLRKSHPRYSMRDSFSREALNDYVKSFGFTLEELENFREKRALFNIKFLQSWEQNRVCKYTKMLNRKKLF